MERIKRFFDELAPRLETARVLDQELDRNLARRFNVLDYLKTDELGLSRSSPICSTPKRAMVRERCSSEVPGEVGRD